ncbi:MAG: hypothetical protein PVS2B3_10590 [Steroidobacteraceae bacterium]
MVIFLGLVIVSALLTVSAVVVLFALASEAEVLPSLSRASGGADEPAASTDNCHRGAATAPRNRAQIPLNN